MSLLVWAALLFRGENTLLASCLMPQAPPSAPETVGLRGGCGTHLQHQRWWG